MILQEAFALGTVWLREANPGICRSWEDLAFLRANWDGPIVLKGIQAVEDAHAAMDAHMDGIVVSNHSAYHLTRASESLSGLIRALYLIEYIAFFIFFWQAHDSGMVPPARSAPWRRLPRHRGCGTPRKKASSPSSSTQVSGQGAMS